MSRLASEHDLAEIRLRLDVGGGIGVRKITREDVRRLLEEVAECWAGNLPDWADEHDGPDCLDDPPPPYVVAKLETLANSAESISRALPTGFGSAASAWKEISESIYDLLEDIEDDDPCCIENKEEARCDTADVLCREAGSRRRVPGPNSGGPAAAPRS